MDSLSPEKWKSRERTAGKRSVSGTKNRLEESLQVFFGMVGELLVKRT